MCAGEAVDRRVGGLLHPREERRAIEDLVLRRGVEEFECLGDARAGHQVRGDRLLFGGDGVEAIKRPVVGLVGIDIGAEVVRQPEEVPVASDGVVGVGGVEDRRPQQCGQSVECGTAAVEGGGQVDGECVVGGDRRGVLRDGRARPIGLCRNQFDLSSCERGSDVAPVLESDDDAVYRRRDRVDPRHHVGALFGGVGGHEVEDVANRLQR